MLFVMFEIFYNLGGGDYLHSGRAISHQTWRKNIWRVCLCSNPGVCDEVANGEDENDDDDARRAGHHLPLPENMEGANDQRRR